MRYAIHKQPRISGKPVHIVVDYGGEKDSHTGRPIMGEFKTKAQAQNWIDKQAKK